MQTIWKGNLSFGLVNLPVRLVSATSKSGVSFRQLHAKDGSPIRMERHCAKDGELVPYEEVVKGYEVAKDAFVVVTKEEIEEAEPESSRALAVREFVLARDIDALYVDASYALAPQPGGERAYALLHDALARREEAAIGQLALRNREHLVAVRAGENALILDVLRYATEVKDLREIGDAIAREGEVTEEEAELADLLLSRMRREWDPTKYEDRYGEAIRSLVAAKARGEVVHAPPSERPAPTTDLLAALRATLEREERAEPPGA